MTQYPVVKDVKTFIPAKDFAISLKFYQALGYQLNWQAEEFAELQLGDYRFLLQDFYVEDFANNFMMQIVIDDAQAWYEHIKTVVDTGDYEGVKLRKPFTESYGAIVCHLIDPTGVLWHFTQFLPNE